MRKCYHSWWSLRSRFNPHRFRNETSRLHRFRTTQIGKVRLYQSTAGTDCFHYFPISITNTVHFLVASNHCTHARTHVRTHARENCSVRARRCMGFHVFELHRLQCNRSSPSQHCVQRHAGSAIRVGCSVRDRAPVLAWRWDIQDQSLCRCEPASSAPF